ALGELAARHGEHVGHEQRFVQIHGGAGVGGVRLVEDGVGGAGTRGEAAGVPVGAVDKRRGAEQAVDNGQGGYTQGARGVPPGAIVKLVRIVEGDGEQTARAPLEGDGAAGGGDRCAAAAGEDVNDFVVELAGALAGASGR